MKAVAGIIVFSSLALQAAGPTPKTDPGVPVSEAPRAKPVSSEEFVYDQKPVSSLPNLVTPEQAQTIIQRFKEAYSTMGNPKLLIYVNRDLVDEKSGMKLVARTETTEASRSKVDSTLEPGTISSTPNNVSVNADGDVTVQSGSAFPNGKGAASGESEKVQNENRYRVQEPNVKLADKQTVRDVERLFGRPLRAAGASLTDQRVATQLMADKKLENFTVATETEAARKDREALGKIADVVLEVLISSRTITVGEISSDKDYSVPDIQATAIRLSDSKVLGQASASDVLGKDRYAGKIVRTFDVRDIAEATALALMEDIAGTTK